jgi:probable rRNA maturation factor
MNLINHSSVPMPRKWMGLWMTAFFRELQKELRNPNLNLSKRELTIVFLDLNAAKKLNLQHRDKNYATDVLSFEGHSSSELGELVICPQVVKRQAKEHELSFRAELGYMLIHGVLHLLGYDHERSKSDAIVMFQIQDQLFDRLRTKFDI